MIRYRVFKNSHRRCSVKKVFLKISQNSQENTSAEVSFQYNCRPQACNFIKKETPTQVFPREFCETFKNTFFTKHFRAAASECFENILKKIEYIESNIVSKHHFHFPITSNLCIIFWKIFIRKHCLRAK